MKSAHRASRIPKRLFYIRPSGRPSGSSKLTNRKVKWIQLTTMHRRHWLRESLWHSRTLCRLWTNINETYVIILQNIYSQATARIHLDTLVFDEFLINRGVRQGDPLSPKLFTVVMEKVFKKADISEGINVDGENLTNLRFVDDVALFN